MLCRGAAMKQGRAETWHHDIRMGGQAGTSKEYTQHSLPVASASTVV